MFKSFMGLKMSTKLLIVLPLYFGMVFLYIYSPLLPQGLFVIPLCLIAIGIPWRKSWFSVPVSIFISIYKDIYMQPIPTPMLINKYGVVLVVFSLLFIIGAQLKMAYDELQEAQEELQRRYDTERELANSDYLTELGNHRYFQQCLSFEMELAERERRSLGLIIFDIDNFKNYNDSHGHQAGDTLLKQIANLIKRNIREGDVACRYGGEEFVIIMPGASSQVIRDRGEKIRKIIEKTSFPGGNVQPGGRITVSGGCASYPEDAENLTDLIRVADEKLYQVKGKAKNQVA